MSLFSENKRQSINAESLATAKLSSIVIGALGGKQAKVKIAELLPFELPAGEQNLRESTKEALKWALKNERLPPAIVGLIGAELR